MNASLAQKAAAGFLWTAAGSLGSRVITTGSTFVLARYLAPDVQGDVNVAFVFVATVGVATSFGVGQYIIANPKVGRGVVFHGSALLIIAGVLACLFCYLTRHLAADRLGAPGMAEFVPGLCVSHFLDRVGGLPRSVLARDLQFRTVSLRVALGELIYACATVGFAMLGWGGQAIVAGNIVRGATGLLFLMAVTDWRDYLLPVRLTWTTMRELMRFGVPMSISYLFHFGSSNWDNVLIGNRFSDATVGLYNHAYRLADLPATSVGEHVTDVLVPTFGQLDDREARQRGVVRACALLSLLVFPMAVGMGAIAPTMVEAFYPRNWAGVAPFLMVLAPLSMTRSIGALAAGYLQVVNRTRVFMLTDAVLVASVLGLMALLSPLGPVWCAAGVGIAFTLNALHLLYTLRPEGIRVLAVVRAVMWPLLASVVMAAGVVGVRHLLDDHLNVWLRLALELVAGAIVYVAAALVIARDASRDGIDLFMGLIRRRRAAASPPAEPTATSPSE